MLKFKNTALIDCICFEMQLQDKSVAPFQMKTASSKLCLSMDSSSSTLWSANLTVGPFLQLPDSWWALQLLSLFSAWIFFSLWSSLRINLATPESDIARAVICDLWSVNCPLGQLFPRSLSYRRLLTLGVTVTKLQRTYQIYQKTTKKNPFHQRLFCHYRPSLAIFSLLTSTIIWLGIQQWLWPEMVNARSGWTHSSQIWHTYHSFPIYFDLAFIILHKINISCNYMYPLGRVNRNHEKSKTQALSQ